MGHVEPGGETERPDRERLWTLWRELKRPFAVWSLLPSAFATPGAWGYVGVDFLSGLRANRSTQRAFDLLAGVDGPTFDALSAFAALNVRRHEQMLKAVVIAYLTVPVSVLALIAEVAGADLVAFAAANVREVVAIGVGLTCGTLAYYLGAWRAHQIVGVLDLVRIERGQSPYTALELRDD